MTTFNLKIMELEVLDKIGDNHMIDFAFDVQNPNPRSQQKNVLEYEQANFELMTEKLNSIDYKEFQEKLNWLNNLLDFFGEVSGVYYDTKTVDLLYLDFKKSSIKFPEKGYDHSGSSWNTKHLLLMDTKLVPWSHPTSDDSQPKLRNLSYERRLQRLELISLEQRRLRGQLIETFKYLNGLNNVTLEGLFERDGCPKKTIPYFQGQSEENFRIVQGALTKNPQISARKSGLDVVESTFIRIIILDLKWYPYKMHVRNKLLDNDLPRRLKFAQWFLQGNVRFVDDIVVGDEAAFHLNGKVNDHIVRTYAPKNQPPNFNFDVGILREKVSVWMGFCGNGHVISPYFYNNNKWR
ncbi:hypothetical protein FHG87_014760 [Trinorchestia longiramus]|nr:hypothetical protein FHG87_014760 [Trinorchestia longiramus]